jgi:hypothetical protein
MDRPPTLIVTLNDLRPEDAAGIIDATRHLRHVIAVRTPSSDMTGAVELARLALTAKIDEALK